MGDITAILDIVLFFEGIRRNYRNGRVSAAIAILILVEATYISGSY